MVGHVQQRVRRRDPLLEGAGRGSACLCTVTHGIVVLACDACTAQRIIMIAEHGTPTRSRPSFVESKRLGLSFSSSWARQVQSVHVALRQRETARGKGVVAAGDFHSLVRSEGGSVWSFGAGWDGRLGHGSESNEVVPRLIAHLEQVVAVAAGGSLCVALDWRPPSRIITRCTRA